jgi:hypothetical protein
MPHIAPGMPGMPQISPHISPHIASGFPPSQDPMMQQQHYQHQNASYGAIPPQHAPYGNPAYALPTQQHIVSTAPKVRL